MQWTTARLDGVLFWSRPALWRGIHIVKRGIRVVKFSFEEVLAFLRALDCGYGASAKPFPIWRVML